MFIDRDIVFEIDFDDKMQLGPERRIERSMKLREEFKELGMSFHRNRVELRFDLDRGDRHGEEWHALKERVKEFCDSKLEGFWTWKLRRLNARDTDGYKLEMDLMFEHESDMETWLKEHGLILRLSL